jgi:hypothetical protein
MGQSPVVNPSKALARGGRLADIGDFEVEQSFRGGMRLNGFDASWPLVRLEISASAIRLRPSWKPLRRTVPVWEARLSELTSVRVSGRLPLLFNCVRVGPEQWAIFWTPRRRQVTASLKTTGLSVDAAPIPHPFLDPGGYRECSRHS